MRDGVVKKTAATFIGCIGASPCPVEVMKKIMDVLHMPEVTVSAAESQAIVKGCS